MDAAEIEENEVVESPESNESDLHMQLSESLFPDSVNDDVEADEVELGDIKDKESENRDHDVDDSPKDEVNDEKQPPASWKKDMHDAYKSLPDEVKDYIQLREDQMRQGLEKDRDDANLGRVMRDTMAPYSEMLRSQGIDEPKMVQSLMNAHYRLSTAPPEEKQALFSQLAQSYGINAPTDEGSTDPIIQNLQNELMQVKQTLSASHERALAEARNRVNAEVEAFASDESHKYFDEVSDDIAGLINAGYSLEDAYEKAVWANPVTREKEIARLQQEKDAEAEKRRKQEAEKAKKARSVNVRSRDTRKAPTAPKGSMEDTMYETLETINNR